MECCKAGEFLYLFAKYEYFYLELCHSFELARHLNIDLFSIDLKIFFLYVWNSIDLITIYVPEIRVHIFDGAITKSFMYNLATVSQGYAGVAQATGENRLS